MERERAGGKEIDRNRHRERHRQTETETEVHSEIYDIVRYMIYI